MLSRIIMAAAVLALVFSVVAADTALAARPEHAKGGGKGGKTNAALSFVQDGSVVTAVAVDAPFEVKGSGFTPGSMVKVGPQGYFMLTDVMVDSTGGFSVPYDGLSIAGTYRWGAWNATTYAILAEATLIVN